MSATHAINVTEAEAWTLDDLIRHTWTEEGRNIGRTLLIKIFAVLREFDARRSDPPVTLPVALAEEECWVIDYHIRRTYVDPTGAPVGKQLLLKVFGALLAASNAEALRGLDLPSGVAGPDERGLRNRFGDLREFLEGNDSGASNAS